MSKIAICPGTFDPLTLGHVDVILRAAKLFDRAIVAVAENIDKSSVLFALEERIDLIKRVFVNEKNAKNIEVEGFHGLLVDFAQQKNATVIVRGLRVISDFEYEFQMAGANRMLSPDIEMIFLMPAMRYEYISSSIVRNIAASGGDVSKFVPKIIQAALKKKFI